MPGSCRIVEHGDAVAGRKTVRGLEDVVDRRLAVLGARQVDSDVGGALFELRFDVVSFDRYGWHLFGVIEVQSCSSVVQAEVEAQGDEEATWPSVYPRALRIRLPY